MGSEVGREVWMVAVDGNHRERHLERT